MNQALPQTIALLTRILAHQYREAVGPWQQYLGVLQCKAHGF